MKSNFNHVYQLKITLKGVAPEIFRQIQVPEIYTFWDLHVAIQDAMGWDDNHLHQFETTNPRTGNKEIIGIPEKMYEGDSADYVTLPGWKLYIRDYFSEERRAMSYLYDFGDGWEHHIEYERILFKQKKQKYPICIAGERACPPEDCGGSYGYKDLLEILNDPDHEEYKGMRMWVGEKFDPEKFDINKTRFDNPEIRWRRRFAEP